MGEHIIQTTSGRVKGFEKDGLVEYLGIPYAKPPVGELRFKRAVPMEPWPGVYEAKEYGPAPVQKDSGEDLGEEDCLTIDIKRPLEGDNLPVFVYIYGGGYHTGRTSDGLYTGEAFARDGLVYVTFQYRLNVLGFYDFTTYPGCENFDSNCGLSDQILAMQWIHENIRSFGGDPGRVTICGESAGGASVVNMLACPGVKGLFQQAICESGLPNCMMTHETSRENIDLFLEGMGWKEEEAAEHLLHDDPHTFSKGTDYVSAKHQYKNPGMFLPGPVQDDLLPVRPIDAVRSGSAAGVKLIIGTNMDEGTMFVFPENTGFPNSWAMIAEMLEKNHHADMIPGIVNFYHPGGVSKEENKDRRKVGTDPFIRFATDYAFEMPAVKIAQAQKQYTDDVWMYRYELVTKSGIDTGWRATHAAELPAVFDVYDHPDHPFGHFVYDGEPRELYEKMVQEIHGDWVRFAKTGDPNPDWQRFTGARSPVRIFDRETRTEVLDRSLLMKVWGDARFYED